MNERGEEKERKRKNKVPASFIKPQKVTPTTKDTAKPLSWDKKKSLPHTVANHGSDEELQTRNSEQTTDDFLVRTGRSGTRPNRATRPVRRATIAGNKCPRKHAQLNDTRQGKTGRVDGRQRKGEKYRGVQQRGDAVDIELFRRRATPEPGDPLSPLVTAEGQGRRGIGTRFRKKVNTAHHHTTSKF